MFDFDFSWAWLYGVLSPFIKTAIILFIGYIIVKYLLKILGKSFERANMDISLSKFLLKATKITLYCIIILSALNSLGISTTGLLAALSAAAVGIALALKDSLSNIAGGILLLISPRFTTGDYIEANGEGGSVLQVDLMHTTLKTPDCRCITIPNGVLINSELTNYSREEQRRVDLTFSIAYSNDPELAKQAVIETASAHPLVLKDPEAPFARVSAYTQNSVTITARVWCKACDYWTVHFDLLEQVRMAFDKNGITMPFSQLDVHVINE